ncbi:hypothetical protein EVAR_43061_1 [Eumeta japonica]|uniref:Uncharacterized protein n=1 Tax=Eumeta variegata TaxID=151549 RepID=A0A4C1WYX2_EUMVA|nr:hypothetical protein EVAR_43061_1 [Eumeta japonica]
MPNQSIPMPIITISETILWTTVSDSRPASARRGPRPQKKHCTSACRNRGKTITRQRTPVTETGHMLHVWCVVCDVLADVRCWCTDLAAASSTRSPPTCAAAAAGQLARAAASPRAPRPTPSRATLCNRTSQTQHRRERYLFGYNSPKVP